MIPLRVVGCAVLLSVGVLTGRAVAADKYVAVGGTGNGTVTAPYGRIQDALSSAQAGDVVIVGPGTYNERLSPVRGGTSTLPITVRARDGRGTVVVTASGRVLTVNYPYVTVEALVLDGQFGADDIVKVGSPATKFTLRNSEVRRTSKDGVDMSAPTDVLIEGSLVHSTLNATNGRTDAHGIVAGSARRLTIRKTEVHTFSGDAFQIDPGRSAPGWDEVTIEDCRFWLQPLTAPTNGFAAGVVAGENAIDTKASATLPRARLVIRNSEFFGFRAGLISNMAALNIKENVDAVIDGVTAHTSEIAFRLRAPANVRVQNAVAHSVAYGVRYEDNIQGLRIWNSTFGSGVTRAFYAASSSSSVLDVRNVAILGTSLPTIANHTSNLAVPATAFVDAARHNYQLTASSPANDRGVTIAEVTTDRQGTKRPQGSAYDIGAYERAVTVTAPDPLDSADVVVHAWKAPVVVGNWQVVSDATAAGGARMASLNLGGSKLSSALAAPADYFDVTFTAEAGRPYRIWVRGLAAGNSYKNDSVFAQFDKSVTSTGTPVFRIGTTSGTPISIEDCSGCGLSGWGWQDNGYELNVLGPAIYFATTGTQRLRIQIREDGVSIDQIVISASAYLTTSPGATRQDTTILLER